MSKGVKVNSFSEVEKVLEEGRVKAYLRERRKERRRQLEELRREEGALEEFSRVKYEKPDEEALEHLEKAREQRAENRKSAKISCGTITHVRFDCKDNTASSGGHEILGIPHSGCVRNMREHFRLLSIRCEDEERGVREFKVRFGWLDHEFGKEVREKLVKVAIKRGSGLWHEVGAPAIMCEPERLFVAIANTMEQTGAFLESFYGKEREEEEKLSKGGRPKGMAKLDDGYWWDGIKWVPPGGTEQHNLQKLAERRLRKKQRGKKRKSHAKRKMSTKHKKGVGENIGIRTGEDREYRMENRSRQVDGGWVDPVYEAQLKEEKAKKEAEKEAK